MGFIDGLFDAVCFVSDTVEGAVSAVAGTASSVVDTVVENPIKSAAIVAGTVVTGGIAWTAAPFLGAVASGAGLGVAGGSLSGAAASSAGLAALGGGSLATGGLGMAGGTAVVTGVGAATGAAVTTAVASKVDS